MQKEVIEDIARDRSRGGDAPLSWHIITSEYPPQIGGVSDYTRQVATGLATQGDNVHVWCPASGNAEDEGVTVHGEMGRMTPQDLRRVGRQLDQFPAPRRILVQWVPHGYGYRSMNLGFCWWLRQRAARRDSVDLMVHEPYLDFQLRSWRQNGAAAVHRLMTAVLLSAASRVWMSIPAWEKCLRPYAFGRALPFAWLPIPSTVPVVASKACTAEVRRRFAPDGTVIIGHLGTYGWPITSLLEPVLETLAEDPRAQSILLMGRGSDAFRAKIIAAKPDRAARIHATGELPPQELSCHLAACDLLLQPYPDGVSSRRTSFMAGLSHGKPVVTTSGALTEDLWAASASVPIASGGASELIEWTRRLCDNAGERSRFGMAATELYRQHFELQRVIETLRSTALLPARPY